MTDENRSDLETGRLLPADDRGSGGSDRNLIFLKDDEEDWKEEEWPLPLGGGGGGGALCLVSLARSLV